MYQPQWHALACPAALSFVAALTVLSPSRAAAEPLDSARALELALARDAELVALRGEAEAARRAVTLARAPVYRPVLSAAVGPRIGGESPQFEIAAGLSQTFETGGKAERREAVALAELEVVEARAREVEVRTAIDALTLWSQWIGAAEETQALEEIRALAEKLVASRVRQVELGGATRVETDALRLELLRADLDLAAARLTRDGLALELQTWLGLDAPPTPPDTIALPAPPDFEGLLARAVDRRGVVQAALAEATLARRRASLARAARSSDVTLGVEAGLEGPEQYLLGTVSFELPFGRRAELEAEVAEGQVAPAEARAEAARRQLTRELRMAFTRYSAARARAELVAGRGLVLMAEAQRVLQRAIDEGVATSGDLFRLIETSLSLTLEGVRARSTAREVAFILHTINEVAR